MGAECYRFWFGGAMPCGMELHQMCMDIDSTRIALPLLVQEVAAFIHDYYARRESGCS